MNKGITSTLANATGNTSPANGAAVEALVEQGDVQGLKMPAWRTAALQARQKRELKGIIKKGTAENEKPETGQ